MHLLLLSFWHQIPPEEGRRRSVAPENPRSSRNFSFFGSLVFFFSSRLWELSNSVAVSSLFPHWIKKLSSKKATCKKFGCYTILLLSPPAALGVSACFHLSTEEQTLFWRAKVSSWERRESEKAGGRRMGRERAFAAWKAVRKWWSRARSQSCGIKETFYINLHFGVWFVH